MNLISKNKKILSLLFAIVMLFSPTSNIVALESSDFKTTSFTDIAGNWAENIIIDLANKGIVKGKGENKFCPEELITRAEFTQIVANSTNLKDNGFDCTFSDVTTKDWFYNVITLAAKSGIIKGSNGKFMPNNNITREDIVVILSRLDLTDNELLEYAQKENNFQDKNNISSYAIGAINYAVEKGLLKGYNDNTIGPKKLAKRNEVCALIYRYLEMHSIPSTNTDIYKHTIKTTNGINILNLTNISFSQPDWINSDIRTQMAISGIINNAKEDKKPVGLIVLNSNPFNFIDSKGNGIPEERKRIDEVFKFFDSLKTPWTFVFGAYDYINLIDKEYILKKANQSKYCIVKGTNSNLFGYTNQIIEIKDSNNIIIDALYLFDTDLSGISSKTSEVFTSTMNTYKKENNKVKAFVFAGTPIPEIDNVFYSNTVINGNNDNSYTKGNTDHFYKAISAQKENLGGLYFGGGKSLTSSFAGKYDDVFMNVSPSSICEINNIEYSIISTSKSKEEAMTKYTYSIKSRKSSDITSSPMIGIKKHPYLSPNEIAKKSITKQHKEELTGLFNGFIDAELEWIASLQAPNGAIPMTLPDYNNCAKIVPVFSDIAAIALLKNPDKYKENVKDYINWHFNNLNSAKTDPNGIDGTIFDYFIYYEDNNNVRQELIKDQNGNIMYYDSTDAYAALFMKVLNVYFNETKDYKLILDNQQNITRIMNSMFATMDNGLCYATPTYKVKYCMDNLEVYRGLENVIELYENAILPKLSKGSNEYNSAYEKYIFYMEKSKLVFESIEKYLWNEHLNVYDPGIGEDGKSLFKPFTWDKYYPYAAAQIQPMAMSIIDPTSIRAQNLYNEFNKHYSNSTKQWENMNIGEFFLCSDLAHLGAIMGDIDKVENFIKLYIEKHSNTGRNWPVYNNDAGLAVLACSDAIDYINNNMIVIDEPINDGDTLPKEFRLREEAQQLFDEGYAINLHQVNKMIDAAKGNYEKEKEIYNYIRNLPMRSDFKYSEPNDYEAIMKQTAANSSIKKVPSDEIMKDKILAAWQGKITGIAAGLPFEMWNYKHIKTYMTKANAWPINDFIPENSPAEKEDGLVIMYKYMCKGNFNHMPGDDDLRFFVLNTNMVDLYGTNFDTWDIGSSWLYGLPFRLLCTAERIAYSNFAQLDEKYMSKPKNHKELIKDVATYANPYREWIGAQIRSDAFGIAAAGNPRLAAKMAYNDAALSHTKNGIYGEMFFAAMMAASFTSNSINEMVDTAMNEIPQNTRFYEAMEQTRVIANNAENIDDLAKKINDEFGHYGTVHVIPNAAACLASIIFSKGNVNDSFGITISMGNDTDCNAATVGAILGAFNGSKSIDKKWTAPFNNTFLHGMENFPTKITDIAIRSFNVYKEINP